MNYTEAIGRFHPLLVHLPIGILAVGLLLAAISRMEKYAMLRPAVSFTLFWGAVSAIGSCVLGYMLSLSGGYNEDLLAKHQWTGIGLAVAATGAWALYRFPKTDMDFTKGISFLLTVSLLVIVGHYGGSLTHGENYLTELFFKKKKEKIATNKTTDSTQVVQNQLVEHSNLSPNDALVLSENSTQNVPKQLVKGGNEATQTLSKQQNTEGVALPKLTAIEPPKMVMAYQEWVQPILEQRCYSCHGATKSKADLRLDSPDFIKKGGENGSIVTAGNPLKSTLYSYLVLPDDDDMHMPPSGKPQLTDEQIKMVHTWIEKGAFFDKAITLSKVGTGVTPITSGDVNSVFSSKIEKTATSQANISTPKTPANALIVPVKTDVKTPIEALAARQLEDKEAFILKQKVDAINTKTLQKFAEQRIIIAKFGEQSNYVTANFINVKNFSNDYLINLKNIDNQLIRLKLTNQPIKDLDLKTISNLKNITRLNLEKTQITDAGLAYLKDMPNLEQLNLYGTNITDKGLTYLADCKNLKVVYLWETKTTTRGIENLKKILRGIQIDTGGVKLVKRDSTKKEIKEKG